MVSIDKTYNEIRKMLDEIDLREVAEIIHLTLHPYFTDTVCQIDLETGELYGVNFTTGELESPNSTTIEIARINQNVDFSRMCEYCDDCVNSCFWENDSHEPNNEELYHECLEDEIYNWLYNGDCGCNLQTWLEQLKDFELGNK